MTFSQEVFFHYFNATSYMKKILPHSFVAKMSGTRIGYSPNSLIHFFWQTGVMNDAETGQGRLNRIPVLGQKNGKLDAKEN